MEECQTSGVPASGGVLDKWSVTQVEECQTSGVPGKWRSARHVEPGKIGARQMEEREKCQTSGGQREVPDKWREEKRA